MSVTRPSLGLWWLPALVVLTGLAVIGFGGPIEWGGAVAAAGFGLAAVLRGVLPEERTAGGLNVRYRAVDVMLSVFVGVNVLGASRLVPHRGGSLTLLFVVDVALLAGIAAAVWRGHVAHRRSHA